jgi:hypothetical protein
MQLIVAGFTDSSDPVPEKTHKRYLYWAMRNGRLEYAGEAPFILWKNLKELPKPLGTLRSKEAIQELRERGLDVRFLLPGNAAYATQYEVEGTWITAKHHCVTGIKGMVKHVPTNAGLVSDTVQVAEGSPYWREVREAGLRLEALLPSKRPRQDPEAAGAPPSKRRLTPVAPDLPRSKQAAPEEPEVGEGGGYVANDAFFRNLLPVAPPPPVAAPPAPLVPQPEPAPPVPQPQPEPAPLVPQPQPEPVPMESQPQPEPLTQQPEDFYGNPTQPSMDPDADAETLDFHEDEHAQSASLEDPVTQVYEPELASQPIVEPSLPSPDPASQPIVEASLEAELASQPIVEASLEPELASQPIVEASLEPPQEPEPSLDPPQEPEDEKPVETQFQRMARSNTAALDSACTEQRVYWTRAMVRRFLDRLCDAVYDLSRDVRDPALWEKVKELVKLPVYERISSVTNIRLMHFRHDRLDPMPHMSPEWRFAFTVGMPIGIRYRTVTEWFDFEQWTRWRDEMASYAGNCFSVN